MKRFVIGRDPSTGEVYISRSTLLAAAAAGALWLAGCKSDRHVPTQKNLVNEAWGQPAEVDATHLELVEPTRQIRVARTHSKTSGFTETEERDLVVNGYRVDNVSDARVYEVVREVLLPGQDPIAGGGAWNLNVVSSAVQRDPAVAQTNGATLNIIGNIYPTYADGEAPDITLNPSGPRVFIALTAEPAKS